MWGGGCLRHVRHIFNSCLPLYTMLACNGVGWKSRSGSHEDGGISPCSRWLSVWIVLVGTDYLVGVWPIVMISVYGSELHHWKSVTMMQVHSLFIFFWMLLFNFYFRYTFHYLLTKYIVVLILLIWSDRFNVAWLLDLTHTCVMPYVVYDWF